MRVLGLEGRDKETVWHLAAYSDLFLDVDSADEAAQSDRGLTVELPHVALTNRAFESTQVARLTNSPLSEEELHALDRWRNDPGHQIHDRSIRLLLGLR